MMNGISLVRLGGLSAMMASGASKAMASGAEAAAVANPSAVTQLSSMGLSLSADAEQSSQEMSPLYDASGASSASVSRAVKQRTESTPQGQVADKALVSALMLAIQNSRMGDMTSARALQANPAVSGIRITA